MKDFKVDDNGALIFLDNGEEKSLLERVIDLEKSNIELKERVKKLEARGLIIEHNE